MTAPTNTLVAGGPDLQRAGARRELSGHVLDHRGRRRRLRPADARRGSRARRMGRVRRRGARAAPPARSCTRARSLGGAGRRRSGGRRAARAARGRVPVPDRARRRCARAPGEARSSRHWAFGSRPPGVPSPSGERSSTWTPSAERTITVIGRAPRARAPTTRCPGRSCATSTPSTSRRRPRRRAGGASRAEARGDRTRARRAGEADVELDALVSSADDAGERYTPGDLDPPPRWLSRPTAPAAGRSWRRTARSGGGRPRPCPAPPWTPTVRETPSPPV